MHFSRNKNHYFTCSKSLSSLAGSICLANKNVGLAISTTPIKHKNVAKASKRPHASPNKKCASTPVNMGEENTITVASASGMCWKA